MIPPEIIDRVREATDIVQVVSQYVSLKKAGANYKGLCPFHNEKTPSFTVHPGKQIFHCFGCGEGGNAFNFLMKAGRMSFLEAVQDLADKAGIALPSQQPGDQEEILQKAKQREEILELLEQSAAWFRRNLRESPEAEAARAYVKKRELSAEIEERFRLGYSPENGLALLKAAKQKGFSEKLLQEAGLISQGEKGLYGRFRGRLMFPIENPAGKVVGFGGRVLGQGEPKYLNSPETQVFSKGQLLFALPQAKEAIRQQGKILVVEGYMDALACHQAGLEFCVATLGTALGDGHARLLKRYTDQVLLWFDNDRAGIQAAQRASEILIGAGFGVKIVRIQGFKDPDELLKAKGKAALLEALEQAREPLAYFIEQGQAQLGAGSDGALLQRKVVLLQSLFTLLAKYPTQMEAEGQLRLAAASLGLNEGAVKADFEAFRQGKEQKAMLAAIPKADASPAKKSPLLEKVEQELLGLAVENADLMEMLQAEFPQPEFSNPLVQAAAQLLWANPGVAVVDLESRLQEEQGELKKFLAALVLGQPAEFYAGEPQKLFEDLLRKLKLERLRYKKALVDGRLKSAEAASQPELLNELLAQSGELAKAMLQLKSEVS